MTLAPSMPRTFEPVPTAFSQLAIETIVVDAAELLGVAERLDAHARQHGDRVSARGIVARAFLEASVRHPGVDARWPLLPTRHGLRASELTAALDAAEGASPLPDDAAVLSVGALDERVPLELRLAFDPRRVDAIEAGMLLREIASMLAEPLELVARA